MRRFSLAVLRPMAGAALFVALLGVSAARADCYSAQQKLPQSTLDQFIADPSALLKQYPQGGSELISRIRDLVASSPSTLSVVMGLLANADKDQTTSIGTALGLASQICLRPDQVYATQIQQDVAEARNDVLAQAYAAVTGNTQIGGTGGGAGGGGGSPGAGGGQTSGFFSSTSGFSSSSSTFSSTATPGSPGAFFTSSTSGASAGPSSTTSFTSSVSPSR